jgi:threonine dehydrogenase-like Zn-dependent dehydrogenase
MVRTREDNMRATVVYGAGDVRVDTVPDARLVEPTDALVVVTNACICGSDLWPYKTMPASGVGYRMGHEFMGIVEAVGADVRTVKKGDPFRRTTPSPADNRRSIATSPSAAAWRQCAPASESFCPTCSRAGFNPGECSIASPSLTASRTATAR